MHVEDSLFIYKYILTYLNYFRTYWISLKFVVTLYFDKSTTNYK